MRPRHGLRSRPGEPYQAREGTVQNDRDLSEYRYDGFLFVCLFSGPAVEGMAAERKEWGQNLAVTPRHKHTRVRLHVALPCQPEGTERKSFHILELMNQTARATELVATGHGRPCIAPKVPVFEFTCLLPNLTSYSAQLPRPRVILVL